MSALAEARSARAEVNPYHVWLEDWSATRLFPAVRLQAQTSEVVLNLHRACPPYPGDHGLSTGLEPGNASLYYYSGAAATTGTLTVNGQAFEVTGLTWKITNTLPVPLVRAQSAGIGFPCSSTTVLPYAHLLRRDDGTLEPTSAGTFCFTGGRRGSLSWQGLAARGAKYLDQEWSHLSS